LAAKVRRGIPVARGCGALVSAGKLVQALRREHLLRAASVFNRIREGLAPARARSHADKSALG
jgi:hypothetical protein